VGAYAQSPVDNRVALSGAGSFATFNSPTDAVWCQGALYITDSGNKQVRVLYANGTSAFLAGSQTATGSLDGVGVSATFNLNSFSGIGIDTSCNAYVANTGANTIRRIAPNGTTTTVVGTIATLNQPADVAVDASGNLIIADNYNHAIRRMDAVTAAVTTLAGGGGGSVSGSTDGGACTSVAHNPAAFISLATGGGGCFCVLARS
jgi:hypothetical protein